MKRLSGLARFYIALTAGFALTILARAPWAWHRGQALRCLFYTAGAMACSRLKVRLPGMTGTLSVNFLFVLVAIMELDLPEALLVALAGMVAQVFWAAQVRPSPVQIVFNLAGVTVSTAAAYALFHSVAVREWDASLPLMLFFASLAYYLVNTVGVAVIIALTEGKSLPAVWREGFLWMAPEYLVGAAIAGLFHAANRWLGWQAAVLIAPAIYLIYRSYRLYVGRLEEEKRHATEIAGMHWRTVEALALAIDAIDNTTHQHLTRVQVYATRIGKELNLGAEEMQALEIASLLHDIGKLAVPQQILNKPGKLSPEEFERMKVHPVVGAEILDRVGFPYPVVPIVRSHHERWDGSGYPFGLRGEEIPVGARILAAVDCLDALASDRQYRRALPLEDAMRKVQAESGRGFDPRVVAVLGSRYPELERLALAQAADVARSSAMPAAETRGSPAAGYEIAAAGGWTQESPEVLAALAEVRQELQNVSEIAGQLGNCVTLAEALPLIAAPVMRQIPHQAAVVYIVRHDSLVPEFVTGEDYALFSSVRMPLGRGISGWVAENRRPIINGDPTVEFGYRNDTNQYSHMRAALAVPLEGPAGVVGVISMYHGEPDHFTREHVRILLGAASKLGLIVHQVLRQREVRRETEADPLTGLPNARQFFLHLDKEIGRCRREERGLVLLVFDVDGLPGINNRFGRGKGDQILREVARVLRDSCREYDYLGRTGGGEFALALPGSPPEAGTRRLQELTGAAEAAAVKVCPEQQITITAGDAAFPENGATAEQLLAEAERRLYRTRMMRTDLATAVAS